MSQRKNHATSDWNSASLGELADHIVATHHAFTRKIVPKLVELIDQWVSGAGPAGPDRYEFQATFTDMEAELAFHMLKEEQMLFPTIKRLEQAKSDGPKIPTDLKDMIRVLDYEHKRGDKDMIDLREMTDGFAPRSDMPAVYNSVMEHLAQLEADVREHTRLEEEILFPKALALAEKLHAQVSHKQPAKKK